MTQQEKIDMLIDALSNLIDRLHYHGSIDPIREEGLLQDAEQALATARE